MNEATRALRKKGYTVKEFLTKIKRGTSWWHMHKNTNAKDNAIMMLAINGLEEK